MKNFFFLNLNLKKCELKKFEFIWGVYLVQGVYLVWGGVPGPGGYLVQRVPGRGVYLVLEGGVPGPRGVYLVLEGVPGPGGYLVPGGVPGPGGCT